MKTNVLILLSILLGSCTRDFEAGHEYPAVHRPIPTGAPGAQGVDTFGKPFDPHHFSGSEVECRERCGTMFPNPPEKPWKEIPADWHCCFHGCMGDGKEGAYCR